MADIMKKCYLVTGATGFLGSHLVKRLLREGQEVVILKRSFSDTSRIVVELDELKAYNLDEISDIAQVFQEQRIDVVVHTATCYGRKEEGIQQVFETNLRFPLNLLEAAVSFHADTFLNTDTFFNTGEIFSRYLNWYALSKKQFSEWGRQFADTGKIRFVDAVLEHMYGEDDSDSKFIPFVVKSLHDNVPELKLTSGEQKRDFIYVGDVVEAYWQILTHQEMADMYQRYEVGTGKATCIRDFAIAAKKLLHSETRLNFGAVQCREGEIMESRADISGLEKLGWKPSMDIDKGILRIVNYKNKMKIVNSGGKPL